MKPSALSRREILLGSLPVASTTMAACRSSKAPRVNGYAFVANAGSKTIGIVNLSRFAREPEIPLPAEPSQISAEPISRRIYVLMPANGSIAEVECQTLRIKRTVRAGSTAVSMQLAGDGKSLWVLCREPRSLVEIDLASGASRRRFAFAAEPSGFALTDNSQRWVEQRAVVACRMPAEKADRLAIIDLTTGKILNSSPLPDSVTALAFRPDGKQILAGTGASMSISILDGRSGGMMVELPVGIAPRNFCFNGDGGQLFVSGHGMDAVVIVSPYQTQVSETVLAGNAPGAMAVSSNPEYLWVTNPVSGDVTVVDVQSRHALGQISTGQNPGGVVITPDQEYALIWNEGSGDLAVVRIAAIRQSSPFHRRFKIAPLFNLIPVGVRPVSAAVCLLG